MPQSRKGTGSSSNSNTQPSVQERSEATIDTLAEFKEFVKDVTKKVNDAVGEKNSSGDNSPVILQYVTDVIIRNQFRSAKWTP